MKLLKKLKSLFWGDEKINVGSQIFIAIVVFSAIALVTSNVLAGKSFSVFGWKIGGADVVLTCGVLCFPITYVLSDLLSEVYGYSASRRVAWISFLCNLFFIIMILLGLVIPGANPYYDSVSDGLKNGLGLDFIDGGSNLGSLGILFASLIAFIFGSLIDDVVFAAFKKKHSISDNNKKFIFRAITSSFIGEVVDSMIFIPLLYYFTKQMGSTITSFWQVCAIILVQAGIKTLYEILVSPLTCVLANKIKMKENIKKEEVIENV